MIALVVTRGIADFPRPLNSRNVVVRFKGNEAATTIYLLCKPVGVSAQIDASDSPFEHADMLIVRREVSGSTSGAFASP